ncbi:unnamed protein product [Nezara viridula]|uniref:Uncharacterized protein n=1 Tax=Nezara viridula TaxID=85310 RepID=A0A9P0MIX1_NEZVI|nr:unnamed protein product [Nezara viridula]
MATGRWIAAVRLGPEDGRKEQRRDKMEVFTTESIVYDTAHLYAPLSDCSWKSHLDRDKRRAKEFSGEEETLVIIKRLGEVGGRRRPDKDAPIAPLNNLFSFVSSYWISPTAPFVVVLQPGLRRRAAHSSFHRGYQFLSWRSMSLLQ